MIIYRPHRGALVDSMAEAKEFESEEEMKRYIVEESEGIWGKPAFSVDNISIMENSYVDERIGWKDVRYVCVSRYLDEIYDVPQCIGMCATNYVRN